MTGARAGPSRAVSVVVPTRDRPELLKDCLSALRASLRPIDELIVADSASVSPSVRDLAAAFDARYVRCDRPGTSRARNVGWRAARHDIVAFIDDDVRVAPGWVDAIARAFDDPGVAFVTGAIDAPPSSKASGPAIALMRQPDAKRLDATTTGVIGHSANLAVRRTALEHTGGFDELLGPGVRFRAAEDLDLFDRLFASGYVGRYEPGAASYHESWRRIRDWIKVQAAYGWGAGARLAKLLRTDRPHALRAAREAFGAWGVRPLARAIKRRDRTSAAGIIVRLAATVAGFGVAVVVPVRDGHLRGRSYPT